jgi:hypothetical protein
MPDKMTPEKNKNMVKDRKWLKKLRELVVLDIQKIELKSEATDMTIIDFEEWLQEIDAEIAKISRSS